MRLSFFSSQYQAIQRVAVVLIVAPLVLSQFHVWREVGRSNLVPSMRLWKSADEKRLRGRGSRKPQLLVRKFNEKPALMEILTSEPGFSFRGKHAELTSRSSWSAWFEGVGSSLSIFYGKSCVSPPLPGMQVTPAV